MRDGQVEITRLADYRPPDFLLDAIELTFELDETETRVRSLLRLRRNPQGNPHAPLRLDGKNLKLRGVTMNQFPLRKSEYQVDDRQLTLLDVSDRFELTIETTIHPHRNTELEGLYLANGLYCTQCEAEGFRKITYFPDRPDVLARFTTEIIADRRQYPVLLSNGNLVASGDREDGKHWARWRDPFPKPCYLFAMVAGNLEHIREEYTTGSGRKVQLKLYTEAQNIPQCRHAMDSLIHAMRWDEQAYGREYDLDLYMIVATNSFNMGAMENKGLNIFNSRYVLASPSTATDMDFHHIEAVIAHEYFHNWSGNRVTCRDWFQLSLKEGFTVFRDQQFSADQDEATVCRIRNVKALRAQQFSEDAGPMAHPVRPSAYQEINNFYTATIYNKGAEVIRMLHRLLGAEAFRRGADLYFTRHDGQAATIEDFLACMAESGAIDLGQFKRWYEQAGTPELDVAQEYDAASATLTLKIHQTCPPTPGQPDKLPLHIPLAMGLIDQHGQPIPLQLEDEPEPLGSSRILPLQDKVETYRFQRVPPGAVPSLLRGFSAPVKLHQTVSDQDLALLLAHDEDDFNRWEAGQRLATNILLRWIADADAQDTLRIYLEAVGALFRNTRLAPAMLAELISLPGDSMLAELVDIVEVDKIHHARQRLRGAIAEQHAEQLLDAYQRMDAAGKTPSAVKPVSARTLKNACLGYLVALPQEPYLELCWRQFQDSETMTDSQAALMLLADSDSPYRAQALETFYQRWQKDDLVVDKWFQAQVMAPHMGTLAVVQQLLEHPAFSITNPNKVRSVIGAFCQGNPLQFHQPDGSGYTFLAEQILRLDQINPQVTARLATPLTRWKKHEPGRRELMRLTLEKIAANNLSGNLNEIVGKTLAG